MKAEADGTLGVGKTVSRSELANTLWVMDAFGISEYAIPAMQWACGAGIIAGTGEGRLQPERDLTREQMSVILYRYSQFPRESS